MIFFRRRLSFVVQGVTGAVLGIFVSAMAATISLAAPPGIGVEQPGATHPGRPGADAVAHWVEIALLTADGWAGAARDDQVLRIERKGQAMLGFRLRASVRIQYRVYSSIGEWTPWRENGACACPGGGLVTGLQMRSGVPLLYRIYTAERGWGGWKENNQIAGRTHGRNLLAGVQFKFGAPRRYPSDPLAPGERGSSHRSG